ARGRSPRRARSGPSPRPSMRTRSRARPGRGRGRRAVRRSSPRRRCRERGRGACVDRLVAACGRRPRAPRRCAEAVGSPVVRRGRRAAP
ncbi:hypothetical protein ESO86_10135, partial [Agromyces binzhouensis]